MTRPVVLHIVTSLDFGGVETHMKIIAAHAEHSSFDHKFCAISRGGAVSGHMIASGTSVTLLGKRPNIPSLSAIWALVRHIRSVRPAILHTHGAEANFHGLIAGRICNVPARIAEEIGFPNHSRKAQLVFRRVYQFADRIIAVSESVKERLAETKEVKLDRMTVILNPVSIETKQPTPPASDYFVIGFVGRLETVKNPISLVRAAALLRDRGLDDFRVKIIGNGSQMADLKMEVASLQLKEIVELPGYSERPFDLLSGCALYVQPSISEGFGLAVVEAMSSGIPVLASAVGGVPEIIHEGENGWLLHATTSDNLADRIAAIAELGSVVLKEIGLRGRESVIARFSPTNYIETCDMLYENLLRRGRAHRGCVII